MEKNFEPVPPTKASEDLNSAKIFYVVVLYLLKPVKPWSLYTLVIWKRAASAHIFHFVSTEERKSRVWT